MTSRRHKWIPTAPSLPALGCLGCLGLLPLALGAALPMVIVTLLGLAEESSGRIPEEGEERE